MRTRLRTTLTAAVAVGALTVGAVLPALAQGDEPDTGTPDTATEQDVEDGTDDRGPRRHGDRGPHHDAFVTALAEELDLPEDEVRTAIETVREQLRTEHRLERRDREGGSHLAERLGRADRPGREDRPRSW
jgi:hypothetical protein